MEKWKAVSLDLISQKRYSTELVVGEEKGLTITLFGDSESFVITFGAVYAFRFLDEGIIQTELYKGDTFLNYRNSGFKEVIYEITEGLFKHEISNCSLGYLDTEKLRHYVIVTMNYVVEIVTDWEPSISAI